MRELLAIHADIKRNTRPGNRQNRFLMRVKVKCHIVRPTITIDAPKLKPWLGLHRIQLAS